MTDDDKTPDERALAALFASLVEHSPPSEVSPLEVIKLGTREKDADLDRRVRRLKVGRNVLVAAVIAGVVVLVVPHLGGGSSSTSAANSNASASSSSSEVRAAAAASGSAGSSGFSSVQSGSAAGGAIPGPAAGSSAAGTSSAAAAASAASGTSSAPAGSPAGSARTGSAPASSAASSGGASSGSGAALSATDGQPHDTSATACAVLPGKAVAAVRAVFPAGNFGAAAAVPGCQSRYGVQLPIPADTGTLLTIIVKRASPGSCDLRTGLDAVCSPVAGSPNVFRQKIPGPTTKLWVYGQGYQILLETADPGLAASVDKLIAAGRAVITSLG